MKHFKESKEFFWTKHAVAKDIFYGLLPSRVRKIFRAPDRTEEGIAPGTVAMMQRVGGKRKTEIWVMWQKSRDGQKKIIAAWRYPGASPVRQVPVPPKILEELKIK
jgi:hypothetical protein